MDNDAKKLAPRSITYGLFIVTSRDSSHLGGAGVRDAGSSPLTLRSTGMNYGG